MGYFLTKVDIFNIKAERLDREAEECIENGDMKQAFFLKEKAVESREKAKQYAELSCLSFPTENNFLKNMKL